MARVRLSSKFNLLGSKEFEVRFIWVRPNTSWDIFQLNLNFKKKSNHPIMHIVFNSDTIFDTFWLWVCRSCSCKNVSKIVLECHSHIPIVFNSVTIFDTFWVLINAQDLSKNYVTTFEVIHNMTCWLLFHSNSIQCRQVLN